MWLGLLKLNTHITYEPTVPLLGTSPTEMSARVHQEKYVGIFTAALLAMVHEQKQHEHDQ